MQLVRLSIDDDPDDAEFYGDVYRLWHLPDGRTLAALTGYQEGANQLNYWDVVAGRSLGRASAVTDDEHGLCYPEPVFSPDAGLVAFGDRLARRADPGRHAFLAASAAIQQGQYYVRLAFGPNAEWVYALHAGRIDRWPVAAALARAGDPDDFGDLELTPPHPDSLPGADGGDMAVSPAGDLLVATAGRQVLRWALPGHRPLVPLAVPDRSGAVTDVRFGPDGHTLAGVTKGGLHLWDPHSGEHRRTLRADAPVPRDLALTPDGGRLLTADDEGGVGVWATADGSRLAALDLADQIGPVAAVTVSADGLTAVAGGTRGRLVRWDL